MAVCRQPLAKSTQHLGNQHSLWKIPNLRGGTQSIIIFRIHWVTEKPVRIWVGVRRSRGRCWELRIVAR